jgi:hypothetical protein
LARDAQIRIIRPRLQTRKTQLGHPVNLIEETIGAEAYNKLLVYVGGTDYHIPGKIGTPAGQQLEQWIGLKAATALIRWGGGSTVYVGGRTQRIIRQRVALLRQKRAEGATLQELSRLTFQTRLTDRQIRFLLNEWSDPEEKSLPEKTPVVCFDLFGDA